MCFRSLRSFCRRFAMTVRAVSSCCHTFNVEFPRSLMFLRNNVFPRDAVNPKGKFYPIFGCGVACAGGSKMGNVPVKLACPVRMASAVCMRRLRMLAAVPKLAVLLRCGLRRPHALSQGGQVFGISCLVADQGWLRLARKADGNGSAWSSPAKRYGGALCPVCFSLSRMVCRKPLGLFVG